MLVRIFIEICISVVVTCKNSGYGNASVIYRVACCNPCVAFEICYRPHSSSLQKYSSMIECENKKISQCTINSKTSQATFL